MIDIRQSKNYANYLKTLGWKVERIDKVNYFLKRLPLIGSVLKIQRPKTINFDKIKKITKKYRVLQTIIEPDLAFAVTSTVHNQIIENGFRLSKNPYLPTKTLQIDLTKPIKQITASFKKDAKSAIRKGSRFLIKEYSTPTEIKMFREAWKSSVKFTRFVPSTDQLINLRKSFPASYSIFLASHNISGSVIGGVIFTRSLHDTVYYWQAFTSNEGRASLSQYSLVYQGILWAKRQKCKVFDFEGIYDPRFPNRTWLGFTHFKKSFGGREVPYPGSYTRLRLPF